MKDKMCKYLERFSVSIFFLIIVVVLWIFHVTIHSNMIGSIDHGGVKAEQYWRIMDVWFVTVNIGGVLFGISTIASLLNRKASKFHIVLKIVISILTLLIVAGNVIGSVIEWKGGFF